MIDRDQHPKRGTAICVDQRQKAVRRGVVSLCSRSKRMKHGPLARLESCSIRKSFHTIDRSRRTPPADPEADKCAPAPHPPSHRAECSSTETLFQSLPPASPRANRYSRRCGYTPDRLRTPQDSSNGRAHQRSRMFESHPSSAGLGSRSIVVPCTNSSSSASGIENLFCVSFSARKTGSSDIPETTSSAPIFDPFGHHDSALFYRHRLIISDVISTPHKGVHSAHGVTFVLGQHTKGVVKILRLALSYGTAGSIGFGNRHVFSPARILPTRAPASRLNFFVLDTTGLPRRTSKS